ncbi:hypothetical protein FEM48_ZijujUnG0074000 [Ziziphus jujuba var. spinosa]|uniref:F-box domain-containing protein n=1 Tax=Ziziphus jujuba var. spinosa TaxID=714518 RepID=A0A978U8U3_ZIZJJ|nr:hypothetical protein FEM48_ZijujUnG0074000 [Ziziphus jujuba var. spinosa]
MEEETLNSSLREYYVDQPLKKIKKMEELEKIHHDHDLISDLPESLIIKITSLLSLEDAIRFSLTSKNLNLLETLKLYDCTRLKNICFSSNNLRTLILMKCQGLENIHITAPYLESFVFDLEKKNHYLLLSRNSIIDLSGILLDPLINAKLCFYMMSLQRFDTDPNSLSLVFCCLLYVISGIRNEKLFQKDNCIAVLVRRFEFMVDEFLEAMRTLGLKEPKLDHPKHWFFPAPGRLVVNVDVAVKGRKSGIALVVRNAYGNVILATAKGMISDSVELAKIKALSWASEVALGKGWKDLGWWSDAQSGVNQINGKDDPCIWDSRFDILHLRELFATNDWSLDWSPRIENHLADALVKWALRGSVYGIWEG